MSTGKMAHRDWIELSEVDPEAAHAVWADGNVDFPPHIARALKANRDFQPLGADKRSAFAPSEHRPDPQDRTGERFEREHSTMVEGQQPAADTTRYTGAEWSALSEVDPEAAIAAHREGRVDFAPHVARQLEANRNFRPIGG